MASTMRIRVLKDFSVAGITFVAGEVLQIDPKTADAWLKRGLVMQDKSLDGARETKRGLKIKTNSIGTGTTSLSQIQ